MSRGYSEGIIDLTGGAECQEKKLEVDVLMGGSLPPPPLQPQNLVESPETLSLAGKARWLPT